MDISSRNLDMIYQLSERDVRASNFPAKVEATVDRRASIAAPLKRWQVTKLEPVPMPMLRMKAS